MCVYTHTHEDEYVCIFLALVWGFQSCILGYAIAD